MQPRDIPMRLDELTLRGVLRVPPRAHGLVLFAHGSGSGRHSPRNNFVAEQLASRDLAALLFDLLTEQEEAADAVSGALRFDIELLAERLIGATRWTLRQTALQPLALGYFGASTGAAAALVAAARLGQVGAIVSRGGRPDLAGAALAQVRAPTLLIVGGQDPEVLALNRTALARMAGTARLEVVPGATHLFEEAGALEQVSVLAADWFQTYLCGARGRPDTVPARPSPQP